MKVSDWLDEWLADRDVAPTTLRTNQQQVKHIKEHIGQLRMKQVGWNEVERMYKALDDELARSTVRSIAGTLSGVFSGAVRHGHIDKNPCRKAKTPPEQPTSFNVLNQDEAKALKGALKEYSAYDLAIFLALDTGMRKSEVMGLCWESVDLERNMLSITDTLVRGPGGSYEFSDPKTESSRRSISLSDYTVDVLNKYSQRQDERRAEAEEWKYPDLVLTKLNGGYLTPRNLGSRLSNRTEKLGITDVTFHELRHSHATILLRQGVHPKKVQERLGHSSISVTLDKYSHVAPTMQREVAEQFSEIYQ